MPGEEMTPEELEMLAREAEERALDARVVAALECVPEVAVPEDFAARVTAAVPPRRVKTMQKLGAVRATYYGRRVMWVSLAVLLVALVTFAVRGVAGTAVGAAVEWLLVTQFLAIAVWLGVRRLSAG